jgi:hypothetical protein
VACADTARGPEAGRDRWRSVFHIEVGFAWSDPEAAIADAKTQIDRLKLKRYAPAGQMSQTKPSAA